MKTETIKANHLEKEIRDLEYFTEYISSRLPNKVDKRFSGIVLKTTEVTKLSLFGAEWFGIGTHKKEIGVPIPMLQTMHEIAVDVLESKKQELNALFGINLRSIRGKEDERNKTN